MRRPASVLLHLLLLPPLACLAPPAARAEEPRAMKAPTRLHHEPAAYLLLRLPGDRVTVRYTPGSLDRAANLQSRLERMTRAARRWVGRDLDLTVYLLSRQEWQDSRYSVVYGVPVRAGRLGLSAPAEGDPGTVELWTELLDGILPSHAGTPIRGTPQQAGTMALADVLTQLLAAEILVDAADLGGDQPWVRALVTQVAAIDFYRRHDPARLADVEAMYAFLARQRPARAMSGRDYDPDLELDDWLWFQAQLYAGARVILDKEGKGALKALKKLRNKDGVLRGERLLDKYDDLETWFRDSFSAVSMRTVP